MVAAFSSGARVLAEFGDDPDRYAGPTARKNYSGMAPITRARGATHHQALRTLANRLVGIPHGCLRHHTRYDQATVWPSGSLKATAA